MKTTIYWLEFPEFFQSIWPERSLFLSLLRAAYPVEV